MSNCNGHSWSKFFWRDWSADKALHPCSLAAKGFWIEMLCIMHEGTPVGHLTLGGKPATIRQMAANAGCTEREATRYLAELLDAGVCSKNENGTVFSRRMVKDTEAAEVGRKYAKRRWNPQKSSPPPIGSPNGEASGEPTGNPNAKSTEEREEERKSTLLTECGAAAEAATPEHTPEVLTPDPREELWQQGVRLVQGLTGMMDRPARSFLGKLLSLAKDDCAHVLALLNEADQQRPLNPSAWLVANAKPFRNAGLAIIAEEGIATEGAAALQRMLLAAEAKGHA